MSVKEHTFYLGCQEPVWLARFAVPMMISRRRLIRYKNLPVALGPVLIDSSGFTEIKDNGCWTFSDEQYVSEARWFKSSLRSVVGVFIKDWMCEPFIIAKTGLSVFEHQSRTVASYLELSLLAPDVPWLPVLQGWTLADYLRCVDMYASAGVDLSAFPLVGVGSICTRQSTSEAVNILSALSNLGLRLHGFGFKTDGLPIAAKYLASSDSMAWSSDARYSHPLDGCEHRNCANCSRYALLWRDRVLSSFAPPVFGSARPASLYRRRSSVLPAGGGQLVMPV